MTPSTQICGCKLMGDFSQYYFMFYRTNRSEFGTMAESTSLL
jgi:hypothetical protein